MANKRQKAAQRAARTRRANYEKKPLVILKEADRGMEGVIGDFIKQTEQALSREALTSVGLKKRYTSRLEGWGQHGLSNDAVEVIYAYCVALLEEAGYRVEYQRVEGDEPPKRVKPPFQVIARGYPGGSARFKAAL